ncbi:MAG: MFS transporter [Planctomycetota bacterium]
MSRSQTGVLFLTIFLDLVGFSIVFPLFPGILDHYLAEEGSQSLIGRTVTLLEGLAGAGENRRWLVETLFGGVLGSLYSLLQFLSSPFWGRLSDRVGRRPLLLLTVAGMALSYLLWAVSGQFLMFLLARILGGFMGGNIAIATAAMADMTSPAQRASGMGIIGAAFGLGFIVGPAIGGALSLIDLSTESPAGALWGLHPFSAAALGAFLLSAANTLWVAWRFQETLPKAKVDLQATRRTANPIAIFTGAGSRSIQLTLMTYFLFLIAFSGMEFTLTFLVRERFLWQPTEIAVMFIYVGLVIAAVQGGVVRKVVPRYGEKKVAQVGLLIILPGLVLLSEARVAGILYSGLTLMALGSALAIPSFTSLVSLYAPQERLGEVLGIFRSAGALARVVGPILASVIYWRFGSRIPYLAGAVLLVLPVVLTFHLPAMEKYRR